MKIRRFVTFFLLIVLSALAHATDFVVNTTMDIHNTSGCTSLSCSLRDAIAAASPTGGDIISFDPTLTPGIIHLQSGPGFGALTIDRPLTISGPDARLLTIKGSGVDRVLEVTAGPISVSGVQLQDGFAGDLGSDGGNGLGGCIYVPVGGTLLLDGVDVRDCLAEGGAGTAGMLTGFGTSGGPGGTGMGGAIFVGGTVTITNSSLVNNAAKGGRGGAGADGDPEGDTGPGNGGVAGAAAGGAIYVDAGGSVLVMNSTLAANTVDGGSGGNSGSDIFDDAADGGKGGDAYGGNIFVNSGASVSNIEFTTVADGNVGGGAGGAGTFSDAPSGSEHGSDIYTSGILNALSSAVVGVQDASLTLCEGRVDSLGSTQNIDDDGSCAFGFSSSPGAKFLPVDLSAVLPVYMPVWRSAVIDNATTCEDGMGASVTADENGTSRPQGSKCDIGAVEADYIFVDGFE